MAASGFKIGVDGGGSKTELILVDGAGTIVARHISPGSNPSQTGPEQARAILIEALAALIAQAPSSGPQDPRPNNPDPKSQTLDPKPSISHTLLCMAGSATFWAETAAVLTGYGTVTTTADSAPVLELATAGAPGLVLHAGTGSFVIYRTPDGVVRYTGGLGWKFGDPGSGFDIGRRGLALALLEIQAAGPDDRPTPLAEALIVHTGLMDYAANSRFFYADPGANVKIASFAPTVLRLAGEPYEPARQAVRDSIADLVRQADDALRRHFPSSEGKIPVGISGTILNSWAGAEAVRATGETLSRPCDLRFLHTPPIEGVRRLLAKL